MRRLERIAVVGCLATLAIACSPPPAPVQDAAPPVVCCPPTPQPECCMQLGGAQMEGVCPDLTCDIPDPATPGWTLKKDFNGCLRWFVPPGPFACGTPPLPPIEAGPPCAPTSVAGYVPGPMTPPRAPASACTAKELGDFYAACIAAGTSSAACSAFQSSDAACSQCLLSQAPDATWGPVVVSLAGTKINIAGCIAIVQNDASATSCAQRASDELGCEAFACDAVCPVTPDAGELAYEQCVQDVAVAGCKKYLDAECDPADAGVSQCIASPLDATSFAALAAVFCGGS